MFTQNVIEPSAAVYELSRWKLSCSTSQWSDNPDQVVL